ncbi:MAG: competence/damage-inducible protein A [Candidatus Firestonebacteria bacterium GWA2_43_8]|nr:MAG: competence/damage-inducible protein A [Candidatus Firestonebacteria bacterium GWA2_43_8]
MNAEIITVGTELLLGQIVDTNFAYIAKRLAEAGINLYFKTSVGDNEKRMSEILKLALSRSDAVIITGGLGPTVDDVTRAALVKTLNLKLVLNEHVLKNIQSFFDSRKIKMSQNNVSQALVPNGATVIENKNGTAPGLLIPYNGKYVIIMPGVPREMKPMMTETVVPFLKAHFKTEGIIKSRVLKTFGLGESRVDEMIGDLFRSSTNPTIALLASHSEVKVRLTARAKDDAEAEVLISELETKIRERLDDNIFGVNDETMEKNVGMLMTMQNLTLATAESCTGGLIADRITDVAGASKYFMRGVISYSNQSKIDTLDVKKITLDMYGAVSKQVAEEMAEGVRKVAGTDIGLGITGIAGPTGGTEQKPVGLVYIALSTDKETISRECRFSGERVLIKERAAQTALDMLRRHLLKI